MKKFITAGLAILLLGASLVFARQQYLENKYQGPSAPQTESWEEIINKDNENKSDPKVQPKEPELASTLNIEMPFFTQAPHGNWDYPWQEACEEASVLLVANLYNEMNLDVDSFNQELLMLVDWEMETFGAYEHTTVAQTQQMIEENYGLETRAHQDPSFEDIQNILNKGNLIVAPFAGKLLNNPNFQNGGPVYHMIVIKGYDAAKQQIVTHDVGTRNGANYVYSWDTIQNALHDWHDDDILLGESLIIEVLHDR